MSISVNCNSNITLFLFLLSVAMFHEQTILFVQKGIYESSNLEFSNLYGMCLLQSCEEGIAKLRTASNNPGTPIYYIVNQILYPLVQGCESKDIKIIKVLKIIICLHKLFTKE